MNAWFLVRHGLQPGRLSIAVLLAAMAGAHAQNAAQMEYERQQREYRQAQEQAREADRQRQQLMNENQRRGQAELNQWTQPAPGQSQGAFPGAGNPGTAGGGGGAPDLRAIWQRRPPLPAERNPLLGRWNPRGAAPADLGAASEAAQLFGAQAAEMARAMVGGMTQGVCDSMFGRGLLEFRPKALVSIGRDGTESVLNRVEYRGGGDRVVVLPQEVGSVGAMVFDFERPDRIKAAGLGCVMARENTAVRAGR